MVGLYPLPKPNIYLSNAIFSCYICFLLNSPFHVQSANVLQQSVFSSAQNWLIAVLSNSQKYFIDLAIVEIRLTRELLGRRLVAQGRLCRILRWLSLLHSKWS
eukprot:TRINITY_DN11170_c0_g1_i3.p2 TRINITY_DN11170_c0_g1~~TRINITY_DN11170_c0_g1_i3.p2  ORF type:complete len:103 (+),score=0.33 TRINITY_DN11170_c0_g1_i3:123-431(+)